MAVILGFTAFSSPSRTGIKTYRVPGTQTELPVKAEVAPLFIGFAQEFDQTVEKLVRGWCWGYAFRAIIGYLRISKHSAGIAIDLNAPRHPLGRRGTFSARQVRQIRVLCRKYGLKWGGDWSRPDEMHFEIVESRSQALARVRRLQAPRATSGHVHATPTVKLGENDQMYAGSPIADLQGHLNAWRAHRGLGKMPRDGDFGATTKYCVEVFQQAYHLPRDGIVGPRTWALVHQHSNGRIA